MVDLDNTLFDLIAKPAKVLAILTAKKSIEAKLFNVSDLSINMNQLHSILWELFIGKNLLCKVETDAFDLVNLIIKLSCLISSILPDIIHATSSNY